MLWLIGLLLTVAWGILWWRFGMSAGAATTPPPALTGNHPSLSTRHYRLADFFPAPVPLVVPPASTEEAASTEPAVEAASPAAEAAEPAPETATPTGELPEGAVHNYLTAPAPSANDEHNRGVELTAAQRRAKMRELMNQAVEKRQTAA